MLLGNDGNDWILATLNHLHGDQSWAQVRRRCTSRHCVATAWWWSSCWLLELQWTPEIMTALALVKIYCHGAKGLEMVVGIAAIALICFDVLQWYLVPRVGFSGPNTFAPRSDTVAPGSGTGPWCCGEAAPFRRCQSGCGRQRRSKPVDSLMFKWGVCVCFRFILSSSGKTCKFE